MKVSDLIREFCEIHPDKYSVYENYSGRFMFGAKCMGIIVRQGNSFMAMIAELTSYLDEYADGKKKKMVAQRESYEEMLAALQDGAQSTEKQIQIEQQADRLLAIADEVEKILA